jgi:hypothetical protein
MARDYKAEHAARKERRAAEEAAAATEENPTTQLPPPEIPEGDGPTQIDPIPPPVVEEPAKKRRGRPPGVKNGEGKAAKARPATTIDVADVKTQIANAGAMLAGLAQGTKWEPLGKSLEWCEMGESPDGVPVILPSRKVDQAVDLMAPYMAESGMLDLVQLSPSGKFAIGCGILLAPTVLVGFQMLWSWAMHPPRAAASVVPMKPAPVAEGK